MPHHKRWFTVVLHMLLAGSLVTACQAASGSISISRPVGLPLRISLDTNGKISFSVEAGLNIPTPIGVIEIGAAIDPALLRGVQNTLTVRYDGQDHLYNLHGQEFEIQFEPGYYQQITLRKQGSNIFLKLVKADVSVSPPTDSAPVISPPTDSAPVILPPPSNPSTVWPFTLQASDTQGLVFSVRAGQRILIRSQGNVHTNPGGTISDCDLWVGPEGISNCRYVSDHAELHGLPFMALIWSFDQVQYWLAGAETRVVAPADGQLILKVNDWSYEDNTGSFNIDVEIQEPASTSNTYTLSAMDSAGIRLSVKSGDHISIRAQGEVHTHPNGEVAECDFWVGPEGIPGCRYVSERPELHGLPFMGLIGSFDQVSYWFVGQQTDVIAPSDGELTLVINDWVYSDNAGEFTLTVVIESQ